jgi:putative flippase GtrA
MSDISVMSISNRLKRLERIAEHALASAALRLSGGRWGANRHAVRQILHEGIRFIAVGGANTVLTYAVYLAALSSLQYGWAFVAAAIAGLLFQALMKIRVVFRSRITIDRFMRYFGYALGYFACYFALLRALVEIGHVRPALAPLMLLCLMTPLHFVASRVIIARD